MSLSGEALYVYHPLVEMVEAEMEGKLLSSNASKKWGTVQMWLRYFNDYPRKKSKIPSR